MSDTDFKGFLPETTAFLKDLKANNTRDWFQANKGVYEKVLRDPAKHFCTTMTGHLADFTGLPHGSKTFRIHRDLRFSKDKTPYNTHLHISFAAIDMPEAPQWFFGLEIDRLVLGTGLFAFSPGTLAAYRNALSGTAGDRLAELLGRLREKGAHVSDAELKKVPRGFPANHRHGDLLRRKSLAVWLTHENPRTACRPDMVDLCLEDFKTLKPVHDWILTLRE